MKTKICTKCKIEKKLNDFHKHKTCKFGVNSWCKVCNLIILRKWRKKFPNKRKIEKLQIYNMSLEDYNTLLKKQNNTCTICKQLEPIIDNRNNQRRDLAVDHNHKTGKVRGLLCSRCNNVLGRIKDNVDILQEAIKYLKG